MKSPESIFLSHVLRYERLTPDNDSKHTCHLEISWSEDHPYKVGDSVAIRPVNRHEWVQPLLERAPQSDDRHSLSELLLHKLNIKTINGKLLRALAPYASGQIATTIESCLKSSENLELLNNTHEAWQLLDAWNLDVPLDVVTSALMPLHPRFYSIASSPSVDPRKIDLTVAHVQYQAPNNPSHPRYGVCSDFLYRSHLSADKSFEAWIHPSKDFFLAPSDQNILMIGPGTGVAPFRAFMQERLHQKAQGALIGKSWLLFGERFENCFFYQKFWNECQTHLDFEVTCAFSREQPQKVYVQDKLWQEREKVWPFLEEGVIYVCGDAKHMAKDVEACLLGIIEEQGKKNPQEAREFLKKLRQNKRYLRDVY